MTSEPRPRGPPCSTGQISPSRPSYLFVARQATHGLPAQKHFAPLPPASTVNAAADALARRSTPQTPSRPQVLRRTRAHPPATPSPSQLSSPSLSRPSVPPVLVPTMTRTNGGGQQQPAGKLPRKRFYRARAHSNPLSDSHFPVPVSPDEFDLSQHYPRYFPEDKGGSETVAAPRIRFADVGCGFGGLLVGLSPLFPDTLMIGMELRDKVIMIFAPVLVRPLFGLLLF